MTDNKYNKDNVYYYLSLPSDTSLTIKLPKELKNKLLEVSTAEGVPYSKTLKNFIIDYIMNKS